MSMELMLKEKSSRFVSTVLVLALIAIGFIALIEKGIPRPQIPIDASPLSPLQYGTSTLYQIARSKYDTRVVLDLSELDSVGGSHCVYIVISPSHPITWSESRIIVSKLLQRCDSIAILVADEETTSNTLLKYINSSIEVLGNRVLSIGNLTPYPRAVMELDGNAYAVVLDLASEVAGGTPFGTVDGAAIVDRDAAFLQTPSYYKYKSRVCVASRERVSDRIDVAVVGDGSIFLNQVLNSNTTLYRVFTEKLLDTLCNGFRTCTILLDAMHSRAIDIRDLGKVIAGLSPQDLLYIYMVYILTLLHPAIWLPPAIATIDRLFPYLFREPVVYISIPLLTIAILYILRRGETILRDEPLKEQSEIELYIAPELRRAIVEGRIKLSSRDFINLYTMVNTVFRNLIGVGLDDSRFPDYVGRYVGAERCSRYWKFMNRYYRRALRKSLWPPIVLWRRVVRRATEESESMLNMLGSSLIQYIPQF